MSTRQSFKTVSHIFLSFLCGILNAFLHFHFVDCFANSLRCTLFTKNVNKKRVKAIRAERSCLLEIFIRFFVCFCQVIKCWNDFVICSVSREWFSTFSRNTTQEIYAFSLSIVRNFCHKNCLTVAKYVLPWKVALNWDYISLYFLLALAASCFHCVSFLPHSLHFCLRGVQFFTRSISLSIILCTNQSRSTLTLVLRLNSISSSF